MDSNQYICLVSCSFRSSKHHHLSCHSIVLILTFQTHNTTTNNSKLGHVHACLFSSSFLPIQAISTSSCAHPHHTLTCYNMCKFWTCMDDASYDHFADTRLSLDPC